MGMHNVNRDTIRCNFEFSKLLQNSTPSKAITRKRNIYYFKWRNGMDYIRVKAIRKGRYLIGGPYSILSYVLCNMNATILYHVNYKKFCELYEKTNEGLVSKNGSTYYVNKKRFTKWVSRNYTKFIYTNKEYADAFRYIRNSVISIPYHPNCFIEKL